VLKQFAALRCGRDSNGDGHIALFALFAAGQAFGLLVDRTTDSRTIRGTSDQVPTLRHRNHDRRKKAPQARHSAKGYRIGTGTSVRTVEARDRCAILLGQLEAEHVDVLGHASRRRRFRDRHEAAFDVPTQHDLRRRAPGTLRDRLERRIREALALPSGLQASVTMRYRSCASRNDRC